MSVLFKGIEMPRNCDVCKFQYRSYNTFVKFCQFHNLDDKLTETVDLIYNALCQD